MTITTACHNTNDLTLIANGFTTAEQLGLDRIKGKAAEPPSGTFFLDFQEGFTPDKVCLIQCQTKT